MKPFHVIKATESYRGEAYEGISANLCGYRNKLEFERAWDATVAASKMQHVNPVGWCVYDSRTGALVHGTPRIVPNQPLPTKRPKGKWQEGMKALAKATEQRHKVKA